MSEIQISVVVPTYHRNDLLARCLECLAPGKQTLDVSLYEVIVTDDGKITTAEQMIRERFPWAKWVQGPQRGPAANRNNGVRHARAEWIAFTDDDCVPSAEWLQTFQHSIAEPSVYEGKTTCLAGCKPVIEEAPINLTGGFLWSCNMMIRRAAFDQVGGFDVNYPFAAMEDIDLLERLKASGHLPVFIPAAIIDHPPRHKKLGVAAARLWESRVLFEYKFHRRNSVRWWLPAHVFKVRCSSLMKEGRNRYGLIGLWSAIIETIYVFVWVPNWHSKYAQQYSGARPLSGNPETF